MLLQAPFIASLVFVSVSITVKPQEDPNHEVMMQKHAAAIGDWGFHLAGRDLDVSPGDDFFHYANGRAVQMMQIPADRTSWGSFAQLREQSEKQVRAILEASAQAGDKMGKLYMSYINETRIEALGATPLQSALRQVTLLRTKTDFARLAGSSSRTFFSSPIGFGIVQDRKEPDSYCLHIDQGRLGLPNRDYYLRSNFAQIKRAYDNFLSQMLQLIGWPEPSRASKDVVAFEERIAQVQWPSSHMRDPVRTYNEMSISSLKAAAPGFDWDLFLGVSGPYPEGTKVVVGAVSAVAGIAKIINQTNVSTLRSWAAARLVTKTAMQLSSPFLNTTLAFSKIISGTRELSARWKRAVAYVNKGMGDAVGRQYVKRHFSPSSKSNVETLTLALKSTFEMRLRRLDWMTNTTRQRALQKLEQFEVQVGYPKKWRSYSDLYVDSADLFGNLERLVRFHWNVSLSKLGQKVDRDVWLVGAQTVNAYFLPLMNMVVFPAAILQPPFFDPYADMAVNFGGIGAVIGHEIIHGFDDAGRKYDAAGRLNNWWTHEDVAEFNKRSFHYGQQFATFSSGLPAGHGINPNLTMGENIADLGGITLAVEAYHQYVKNSSAGSPMSPLVSPNSDGREGDRRLFLAFAQIWASKTRPEALALQLAVGPHSPAIARVNVPLSNLDSWYEAFNITSGNMTRPRADRISIW